MGDQGGDATHEHEHEHNDDANHGHSHDEPKRSKGLGLERRTRGVQGLELRSGDAGVLRMTGYASLTNSPYAVTDFLGEYQETIQRGAFSNAVGTDDVRLLLNHDGLPLARTKSGTLSLDEDERGLRIDAQLDGDSPQVQSIASAMKRGDLDQMSFAFQALRQAWSPDYMQRNISEVKLFDVSVVTYPANPATSAALRSTKVEESQRLSLILRELREGKTFSAENQKQLASLLASISQIDDIVDEWQPKLAEMLGVPNPDKDDDDEGKSDDESNSRSWISASVAEALAHLYKSN
jgi:HK97 family phage prohead protease